MARQLLRSDLLRGSTKARHFGQALHRSVMVSEQLRHLLIELREVVFDHAQFIERQLHQPPIHRMKIRHAPRTEGVAQLLGRCPQSLIGQCGQRGRIHPMGRTSTPPSGL